MARSRPFSIFLLKTDFDSANALKEDSDLLGSVSAKGIPETALLFLGRSKLSTPWWKDYFQVEGVLPQAAQGALMFLQVEGREFALAFGHVQHHLKDESYEHDFGLRVTLNCVDPKKIKNTDTMEPGTARRQRTQVAIDSDLTFFDFDRDSDVLKSLTGKVKTEYEDLIKSVTGSSNLRISTAAPSGDLVDICSQLLSLFASDDYKKSFPDIQNIVPVRDPAEISYLDQHLLHAVQSGTTEVYLTVPQLVDYDSNVFVSFAGEGASQVYESAYLARYHEYLSETDTELTSLTLEDLKRHDLTLVNSDGQRKKSFSIYSSLLFEAPPLPANMTVSTMAQDAVFHFIEGTWYRVEKKYIAQLKSYLDPYCVDLQLPACIDHLESGYNKRVAGDMKYVCLDTKDVSPAGQSQIEPCDLFTTDGAFSVLIHIKISTASGTLSHLFNQGANSVAILRGNSDSVDRLSALVQSAAATGSPPALSREIDVEKLRVVYGIITHKDPVGKSDNLPLFSRISLVRSLKALHIMRVPVQFGFIADHAPDVPGKKKQRKHSPKTAALPPASVAVAGPVAA